MKLVISVSSGSDDATRATLGMVAAKAAVEQGHAVTVWLQGEGVYLASRNVYPAIQGHNIPPMRDVMQALLAAKVPLWVCKACAEGRDVKPENVVPTADFRAMPDYVQAVLAADKNLEF